MPNHFSQQLSLSLLVLGQYCNLNFLHFCMCVCMHASMHACVGSRHAIMLMQWSEDNLQESVLSFTMCNPTHVRHGGKRYPAGPDLFLIVQYLVQLGNTLQLSYTHSAKHSFSLYLKVAHRNLWFCLWTRTHCSLAVPKLAMQTMLSLDLH